MVALFSFLLVRRRPMGNSYENVGRFGKSPSGRFKKSSYRFSFLLVRRRLMGNSYENVGRFCKLPGGSASDLFAGQGQEHIFQVGLFHFQV